MIEFADIPVELQSIVLELQRKKDEASQMTTIVANVMSLKLEIKRRDRAIAKAHRKQRAADEELQRLTSLLQTFSSLTITPPSTSTSIQEPLYVIDSTPVLDVVFVTSDNLSDVLKQMVSNTTPTIYDFQGRTLKIPGGGSPSIKSVGVTWRNGTVELMGFHCLHIQCARMVMESMIINGCDYGIAIWDGGSLTMKSCVVRCAWWGLLLLGSGSLSATNLEVTHCGSVSIYLRDTSTAFLTDCEISGTDRKQGSERWQAIYMRDNSSMMGTRICIKGGNEAGGSMLDLGDNTKLSLTDSKILCPPGIKSKSAVLELYGCVMDGEVDSNSVGKERSKPFNR